MTRVDSDDAMDAALTRLPLLMPDPIRSGRLRARCRTELVRRRRATRPGLAPGVEAFIGGLCLLYLGAILHDVLELRGLF